MSVGAQNDARTLELENLLKNEEQIEALKQHLDELVQSVDFRGSHRSQQFLRYVVEKTLQGSFESLKERIIGVELFQRSPSYDTSEDAIVRVTASDVRRRLLQHYGRFGDTSRFRISLPPGSYLPEFECESFVSATPDESKILPLPVLSEGAPLVENTDRVEEASRQRPRWIWQATVALTIMLMALTGFGLRRWRAQTITAALPPWNVIYRTGQITQLITSDPSLEELQQLEGHSISLSDYANQKYVLDAGALSPELRQFYEFFLHADNAAVVDTPLAVNIARIIPQEFKIRVRSARSLRVTDFKTDDNMILIGSPRSNPWFDLFGDQLDFKFVYSQELNLEIIENLHPAAGEKATYVPTARGFATGESFAIVAFIQNLNQTGHVLLLAGANGEGTEAAGNLVTERSHLLHALQYCGAFPEGPPESFELLLRLHTMAGSPNVVEMAACHRLSGHRPG